MGFTVFPKNFQPSNWITLPSNSMHISFLDACQLVNGFLLYTHSFFTFFFYSILFIHILFGLRQLFLFHLLSLFCGVASSHLFGRFPFRDAYHIVRNSMYRENLVFMNSFPVNKCIPCIVPNVAGCNDRNGKWKHDESKLRWKCSNANEDRYTLYNLPLALKMVEIVHRRKFN